MDETPKKTLSSSTSCHTTIISTPDVTPPPRKALKVDENLNPWDVPFEVAQNIVGYLPIYDAVRSALPTNRVFRAAVTPTVLGRYICEVLSPVVGVDTPTLTMTEILDPLFKIIGTLSPSQVTNKYTLYYDELSAIVYLMYCFKKEIAIEIDIYENPNTKVLGERERNYWPVAGMWIRYGGPALMLNGRKVDYLWWDCCCYRVVYELALSQALRRKNLLHVQQLFQEKNWWAECRCEGHCTADIAACSPPFEFEHLTMIAQLGLEEMSLEEEKKALEICQYVFENVEGVWRSAFFYVTLMRFSWRIAKQLKELTKMRDSEVVKMVNMVWGSVDEYISYLNRRSFPFEIICWLLILVICVDGTSISIPTA